MSRSTPHRSRSPLVLVEEGPDGLRAKEFHQRADAEYWEGLWDDRHVDYGPALGGHLPHQLRTTFGTKVAPPARVLEAGCGLGHFTVAVHALGYEAVGVDWGRKTIQQLATQFPDIEFRHGDVRALEDPDNSFDAVYSPGVCEHFEEGPDQVLQETFRVLRPGGLAVVSTPHLNPLRRRRWGGRDLGGTGEFYQYFFTTSGMARTLSRIGFTDIDAHPYGVWLTFSTEWPMLRRIPSGRALGVLDQLPGVRHLGGSCVWTARKGAAP